MKTEVKDNLVVGDVMILVKSQGDSPETINIDRLTKTQIVVRISDTETWRFKREAAWTRPGEPIGRHQPISGKYPMGSASLFDHSLEAAGILVKKHVAHKQQTAEKKEAEEKLKKKNDERHQQELAEVKAATNGILSHKWQESKSDGSRLYVINLPIHPQRVDRKKGWETMIIHCWDAKHWDFGINESEEADVVEYAVTYCNGSNGSFGSIGTSYAKTEEDALWEAARRQYHSW